MWQPLDDPLLPVDESSRDLTACASDSAPEPMHRVTFTFDDPTLEAAFAASAFRDALLPHVGLLTLGTAGLGVAYGAYASSQDLVVMVLVLLTLVFRVYLHQHTEAQKAQKLGTACWTLGVVIEVLNDIAFLWGSTDAQQHEDACGTAFYSPYLGAIIGFAVGMVNGTHGMGFWLKTALAAVMAADALLIALSCSHSDGVGVYATSLLLGFATSHALEYAKRRNYLQHEEQTVGYERQRYDIALLHRENERLRQQLESGARATGGSAEPESAPTSESAPSSVPAAAPSADAPPQLTSGAGPSGLPPPAGAMRAPSASSASSGTSFDREPDPRPRNQAEADALAAKRQACTDRQLARRRRHIAERQWPLVRLLWIGLRDPGSMCHVLRADVVLLIVGHLLDDPRPFTTLPPPPPQPPSPPPAVAVVPLFLRPPNACGPKPGAQRSCRIQ